MSIYGSLAAPADIEHEDGCAAWDKSGNIWHLHAEHCDCDQPDAPLVYQGSHVLPEITDKRGGWVDIALINTHVRYWQDHPNEPVETEPEGHEPFLRFGVNNETVVLTERNVRQIHETLTWWLNNL